MLLFYSYPKLPDPTKKI